MKNISNTFVPFVPSILLKQITTKNIKVINPSGARISVL